MVKQKPRLGDIRYHPQRKLKYVYEYIPGTEKRQWLRLDTLKVGKWAENDLRTARGSSLRSIRKKKKNTR